MNILNILTGTVDKIFWTLHLLLTSPLVCKFPRHWGILRTLHWLLIWWRGIWRYQCPLRLLATGYTSILIRSWLTRHCEVSSNWQRRNSEDHWGLRPEHEHLKLCSYDDSIAMTHPRMILVESRHWTKILILAKRLNPQISSNILHRALLLQWGER